MRQAIRVYAIVALVVLGALLAVWWTHPNEATYQRSWVAVLDLVVAAQFWVLLVIPLGVLAASDAAHAGRRGWLAAFTVLLVLAPIAARIESLAAGIWHLSNSSCPACFGPNGGDQSQLLYLAGWTLALLPVPLAALIYTLAPVRDTPRAQVDIGMGGGARRLIVVCAVVGAAVMGVLGFLVSSNFILAHFGSGTVAHILYIGALRDLLDQVWLTLLDALPLAVATLALAHAIRTGHGGWLAGWIAIVVLAMVVANLYALTATIALFSPLPAPETGPTVVQMPFQVISAVVPVVVMLLALIYALMMRPGAQQRAAALAGV